MGEFWETRIVKHSRKEHTCKMCRGTINIGDSCSGESGVYNGEFNHYYLCNRCRELLDKDRKQWLGDDNELIDFEDLLTEGDYLKCPDCNSINMKDTSFDKKMLSVDCECECGYRFSMDLSAENLLGNREKVDKND